MSYPIQMNSGSDYSQSLKRLSHQNGQITLVYKGQIGINTYIVPEVQDIGYQSF